MQISYSKVLAFLIAFGGFTICMKMLGGSVDVIQATKVWGITILVSGLLIGNKTIAQSLEKFIDKKFSGGQ